MAVRIQHRTAIIPAEVDKRAGEHQCYLRVVGRLAGHVAPGPTISQLANPIRKSLVNGSRVAELHEPTQ